MRDQYDQLVIFGKIRDEIIFSAIKFRISLSGTLSSLSL